MRHVSHRALPAFLLAGALAFSPVLLAGCSSNTADQQASQATEAATTTDATTTDSTATTTQTADANVIDKDAALQIALSDAGVTQDQVTVTKQALTTDDGVQVYEIEFNGANSEHDYTIDAATGQILEKDNEAYTSTSDSTTTTQDAAVASANASTGTIDLNAAKAIAAEHAGFSASQVTFTEAKLDTDDGVQVYDVTFTANGAEHEYTINAATGQILSTEKDVQ